MSEKKVTRKHVTILQSEVIEKRNVKSRHSKVKLWIANLLKFELVDNFQYVYRFSYKGAVRLKINDIVTNEQGVVFVVVREVNRMAMIVSQDHLISKPKVYGKLIILDK